MTHGDFGFGWSPGPQCPSRLLRHLVDVCGNRLAEKVANAGFISPALSEAQSTFEALPGFQSVATRWAWPGRLAFPGVTAQAFGRPRRYGVVWGHAIGQGTPPETPREPARSYRGRRELAAPGVSAARTRARPRCIRRRGESIRFPKVSHYPITSQMHQL